MRSILKKGISVLLALSLLLSAGSFSAFAATVSEGENGKTIYVSTTASATKGGSAATSIAANDYFYLEIGFAGNPTELADSIQNYGLFITYDESKMTPISWLDGLTAPQHTETNGVIAIAWGSTDGIFVKDTNPPFASHIQSEGAFGYECFQAKEDLDEEELSNFTFLPSYDAKGAVIADSSKKFTIVQTPALSASVKDGAKIYTSSTAEEIAKLLDVTYIDDTGAPSAVSSGVEVTLPAGGLKVGANTLTATANKVSCTFEATVQEDTLTKIEITTVPTKVTYTAFENFDATGMVVTATYKSGKTKDVTDYCAFAPSTRLEVTDTQVEVTYQGETVY